MNLIVAIDKNNGIGKNGDLLCHLSADLKHFKEVTTGKTVIMGYNTLISLPKSAPLKNRRNIVLYENDITVEGAEIVHSLDELFELLGDIDNDEYFVIGGAMVYTLLMPYCKKLFITHIDKAFDADRFLPEIKADEWRAIEESEPMEEEGIPFRYVTYERI
ncbi:MAG: dihydrofolate reductase [Ruminococcaceae bacterium]|nr:dihydrofolate reductase [Oscillospiraceae bacterium]